mmetsp:Transcript_21064/g.32628  ORF Transcript_21064/g.32628 Transcript_21064/m.32628 type:complete len:94 (-) Transcript_21064:531-812(-)
MYEKFKDRNMDKLDQFERRTVAAHLLVHNPKNLFVANKIKVPVREDMKEEEKTTDLSLVELDFTIEEEKKEEMQSSRRSDDESVYDVDLKAFQ